MSHRSNTTQNKLALEQAAQWFVELNDNELSEESKLRFENWFTQGKNQQAWYRVLDMNSTFSQLQNYQHSNPNILPTLQHPAISRRNTLKCLGVFGLSFLTYQSSRTPLVRSQWTKLNAEYSVDIGQSQQLTLADNTQVWLNTNSAIDTAYSDALREIKLLQGEIFVATAQDKQRQLVVSSQWQQQTIQLQALGTKFNVLNTENRLELTVYDGSVEFKSTSNSESQIIHSGERMSLTADGFSELESINTLADWRQGKLVAENMPLVEFCQHLNRYRVGVIRVSPEAEKLSLDGVFPMFDTDKSLSMLEHTLPVNIHYLTPWWVTVSVK